VPERKCSESWISNKLIPTSVDEDRNPRQLRSRNWF
jgi:hypothetical protein